MLEPQHAEAKFLQDIGFATHRGRLPERHIAAMRAGMNERLDYLNASDLTSFLSQIKYLNSEFDAADLVPLPLPSAASFSERRAAVSKQSARVRSQLELKFNCISLMARASTQNTQGCTFVRPVEHRLQYNPLQTIRNRARRPPAFAVPPTLLWHISVSEQVKDFSWRYKRARRIAASSSGGGGGSSSANAATPGQQQQQQQNGSGSSAGPGSSAASTISGGSPTLACETAANTAANTGSAARRRGSRLTYARSRSFTSLPPSECGELIARLRLAHDGPEEEFAAGAPAAGRFCRSNASVADTYSRLKKGTSSVASEEGAAGSAAGGSPLLTVTMTTDNGNEKAVAGVDSGDSVPAMHNRRRSDHSLKFKLPAASDELQLPMFAEFSDQTSVQSARSVRSVRSGLSIAGSTTGSTGSGGNSSNGSGNNGSSSNGSGNSNSGSDSSLGSSVTDLASATPALPFTPAFSPAFSSVPPVPAPAPAPAEAHSLRPSLFDSRKDPWERTMATLESELRFLIPFYEIALNRFDPQQKCDALVARLDHASRQERTAVLCDSVKLEQVPAHLRFLSRIENEAVARQQQLDSQVASMVDGLRVSTDLMVSEVNTTLSRKIRSLTSRIEKQWNPCDCGLVTNMSYSAIEYAVMGAMWACWVSVKAWKALRCVLYLLRAICNILCV